MEHGTWSIEPLRQFLVQCSMLNVHIYGANQKKKKLAVERSKEKKLKKSRKDQQIPEDNWEGSKLNEPLKQ